MKPLAGKVALVTGASRGVGKGVALGLGEAGATVYVTGRTVEESRAAVSLPGTIHQTADEVARLGGKGVAVRCDHRNDREVESVYQRIRAAGNRLDVLVNNVWGGYEHFNNGTEFWKEKGFWTVPISRWDAMFQAGVRAHYVAAVLAAPIMIARHSGLIVNISFFAAPRDGKKGLPMGWPKPLRTAWWPAWRSNCAGTTWRRCRSIPAWSAPRRS